MSGNGINTEMTGDQHPLMLCKVQPIKIFEYKTLSYPLDMITSEEASRSFYFARNIDVKILF
jgi:hypothetical protein